MYLVSLELNNVRSISHIAVDFRDSVAGEGNRRWTILLGENGCGKTTILKSIGLILAGSEALPDILGSPDQWIRNKADRAEIHAVISTDDGQERNLSLVLNRGDGISNVLLNNAEGLSRIDAAIRKADRNYFIAGYGAFRSPPDTNNLFATRSYSSRLGLRSQQLGTLFSKSSELIGLEQWAMDLDYVHGKKGRSIIVDAINKLLPGMSFKDIDKSSRSIILNTQDGDVPLNQLSEGYQVMAAWAGDLLFRMTETFEDYKNPMDARGLLLIDEMDLHLHPVWKRSLVEFLNNAFPRLQIVATTHSPLSVQECREGELYVVRREDDGPTLVPFIGDPSMMRLSELFLSPLIGLETLDSPRVAALRSQARSIELKEGKRSKRDETALAGIQQQLQSTTPLPVSEAPDLEGALHLQRLQTLGSDAETSGAEPDFVSSIRALLASHPLLQPTATLQHEVPTRPDLESRSKAGAKKRTSGVKRLENKKDS
jgi:predicted ATPase